VRSGLLTNTGTSVYGFLTIPEDAKLGVSAHELGHLSKQMQRTALDPS